MGSETYPLEARYCCPESYLHSAHAAALCTHVGRLRTAQSTWAYITQGLALYMKRGSESY